MPDGRLRGGCGRHPLDSEFTLSATRRFYWQLAPIQVLLNPCGSSPHVIAQRRYYKTTDRSGCPSNTLAGASAWPTCSQWQYLVSPDQQLGTLPNAVATAALLDSVLLLAVDSWHFLCTRWMQTCSRRPTHLRGTLRHTMATSRYAGELPPQREPSVWPRGGP